MTIVTLVWASKNDELIVSLLVTIGTCYDVGTGGVQMLHVGAGRANYMLLPQNIA